MQRILFTIVASVTFFNAARACATKADSLVAYLKNNRKIVNSRDSADFVRVILPPDTTVDKDLYRVYDYYLDGKRKSIATSLSGAANVIYDGTCINYFENGHRRSTIQYKNGLQVGDLTNYYPNGKIYELLKIEDHNSGYNEYYRGYPGYSYNYKVNVIELRDSTGKILAQNGTGHVIIFDEDFKKIIAEGEIKDSKNDGEWTGPLGDTARFTCIFHKGNLKSGVSYTKSGKQYTFKQFTTRAIFDDGKDDFGLFIGRNAQFPESEKRKVSGSVILGFYVETDGTLSGITVTKSLIKSLDEEALKAAKQSPPWSPATRYGIPLREYRTVAVYF